MIRQQLADLEQKALALNQQILRLHRERDILTSQLSTSGTPISFERFNQILLQLYVQWEIADESHVQPSPKRLKNMLHLGFSTTVNDCVNTPKALWKLLERRYNSTLFDPCPPEPTADGSRINWNSPTLLNPPYSELPFWTRCSIEQYHAGVTVILLIPIRSNTNYWTTNLFPYATGFWFLPPITFETYTTPFPVPLCLIELDPSKSPIFQRLHEDTQFPMWTFVPVSPLPATE
eukprot:TRINITY_DN15071_c0_g1_i2.p1 TRINITY_DN15071_c0_g1~~TRINITY_DN15071_c0_g1_i2.p1  ORF type:complete len:234 (-),score=37.25 TRINITY_DN15071_c0_g1_i2:100-801(-)